MNKVFEKQKIIENYMKSYEETIKQTMSRNNDNLYKSLQGFLQMYNSDHGILDSQVPTCMVVTSSESASSIDTQFSAICDELKHKCGAINLILDEKKCATMKSTVEHVQALLKQALGIKDDPYAQAKPEEDSDEDRIEYINQVEESIDEDYESDQEDVEMQNAECSSSNHVSTLRDPSFSSHNITNSMVVD